MTYTGDVTVGGPADTRELPGLSITKVAVGPMNNNAYLLRCSNTGELLLIDAANEASTLLGLVGGTPLATIVTTHRHGDHWQALEEVQQTTGARTIAHPDDAGEIPIPATELVRQGSTVRVGDAELSVIHLRGHTPGSIALCYDAAGELADQPHLFTGDSLFPGGPGNTQRDPQRFSQLMNDLEERVFGPLPDGTWIYPGHGNDTTPGTERSHVPEWRARGW
jgi:glyoxylase-like metal-dependent hydrolase (beta-lactamase superfamily II)